MSLHDRLLQSARACEGAAIALAHSLRPTTTRQPPNLIDTYREAEAFAITVRAVLDEAAPLLPLLAPDAVTIGRHPDLQPVDTPVRNGLDSLASILCALFDTAVEAILDVAGHRTRFVNPLQAGVAFEKMCIHHGQLRALYGLVHVMGKLVHKIDFEREVFVREGWDPEGVKGAIRLDDFWGRGFGFQYRKDVRGVLRVVNVVRGSVSKSHEGGGSELVRNVSMVGWGWLYSVKGLMEVLGVGIEGVGVGGEGLGIEALRKFMNMVEEPLVAGVSGLASADVALNEVFEIPREEWRGCEEILKSLGGGVRVRLMSGRSRPTDLPRGGEGSRLANSIQSELSRLQSNVESFLGIEGPELASGLILHVHGGGFVSQSSASSTYVREWCAQIEDAVVLAVDYRLAPEERWPTALHEVVYAYLWALRNATRLGTRGERVVFTGDSAGGNLAVAAAMLVQRMGIRAPDRVVVAYPALYVTMAWSASRLMSFFDPLLPLSVLQLCLQSYVPEGVEGGEEALVSPVVADDEVLNKLPGICVVCGALDPLLDDAVWFMERLRRVRGGDVLRVVQDMPHGFLNMAQVNETARGALAFMGGEIATGLQVAFRGGGKESAAVAAVASPSAFG